MHNFCKQHVLKENQATVLIITKSLRYDCTSFTLTILPLIRYVKFPPENAFVGKLIKVVIPPPGKWLKYILRKVVRFALSKKKDPKKKTNRRKATNYI